MSLYPSLEDMQVDKMMKVQENAYTQYQQQAIGSSSSGATLNSPTTSTQEFNKELYPDLFDFMGLELSHAVISENMPEYIRGNQVALPQQRSVVNSSIGNGMIAPLSGGSVGLQRANVTHGIRELILCKGADKKVGLRVQSIDKGIFVCLVLKNSPAALGGLRFGDQIIQINGQLVAGYTVDNCHDLLKKSDKNNISIIVRDRPFERTISLHKDSRGTVGFQFNNGKITAIVKDSSAARNGLLIDHYILEVDGQNVVGMKDKEINKAISDAGQIVTFTIIPKYIYDHMMKKLSTSFIRGIMDHSISDF